jgi:hypothetical protein
MNKQRVYLEISGGAWEASWWHYEEGKYLRERSYEPMEAVRKLVKRVGLENYVVVRV